MNSKRKVVWDKSNGLCWYCGEELPERGWHADHFIPVDRIDGKMTSPENHNLDNLVPACASCNIMKSNMDIETFRRLISNFVKRLNRDITVYRHAKRYGLIKETGKEVKFWFEEGIKNE